MNIAQIERQALCDLLQRVGPEAPTLNEGWVTRDLAAHLVLRETRPDGALGVLIKPLAGYTKKVQDRIASIPWPELLDRLRNGPPRLSPFGIPGVDARANLGEFYVHHEDVRRAQDDWEPRPADGERYRALERMLMKMGRLLLRRSPFTVRLDPGTGQPFVGHGSDKPGGVTVVGSPDELTLWCFGREDVAQVELIGSETDVAALRAAERGL